VPVADGWHRDALVSLGWIMAPGPSQIGPMAHPPPPPRGRALRLPESLHRTAALARNGARSGAHPIDRALRLRTLWLAYLLAMLFHVDLGLMPLFHGLSPEIASQVPPARLGFLFWAMLVYFLIPLGSLLRIAWAASQPTRPGHWRRWRRTHFWISVLYTLTNIPHLVADILVPDSRGDQVALMAVLLLIGVVINREAWAWWRETQG